MSVTEKSNNYCVLENIYSLSSIDQYQIGFYKGFEQLKNHKCYAWLIKELITVEYLPSNPSQQDCCNYFYKTYCTNGFCSGEASVFLDHLQKGGKLDAAADFEGLKATMRIENVFYHHLLQLPFIRAQDAKAKFESEISLRKQLKEASQKLGQADEENAKALDRAERKRKKRSEEIETLKKNFPIFSCVKATALLSGASPEAYQTALQQAAASLGCEKEETLRGTLSPPNHVMGWQWSKKEGFLVIDQLNVYRFPDEKTFFEGIRALVLKGPTINNREDLEISFEILPPLKKEEIEEVEEKTLAPRFPIEGEKFAANSSYTVYQDHFKKVKPPSQGDIRGELNGLKAGFRFTYNAKGNCLLQDMQGGRIHEYKNEQELVQAMYSFTQMYVNLWRTDKDTPVSFKITGAD